MVKADIEGKKANRLVLVAFALLDILVSNPGWERVFVYVLRARSEVANGLELVDSY